MELGIRLIYSSPRYPKANGLAKLTNKTIINIIKREQRKYKSKWVEELLGAQWSYHTTHKSVTRETPFSLVCSAEIMLPIEASIWISRMEFTIEPDYSESLEVDLKLLKERREDEKQAMKNQSRQVKSIFDKSMRTKTFNEEELSLSWIF